MTASSETLHTVRSLSQEGYKYGFVTDIEAETAPPGLTEDTVRFISARKEEPEWLLEWRLAAFRAWQKMTQPDWAKLHLAPIDYQAATYYSAPKQNTGPKSLDEVDPELLRTYEKLGIPLREREALAGVAVDAVFDSISVATTFKGELSKLGIIFCSMGEAVREHPDLVRKYLGTVVPQNDNFFAALNSAVFSDGSFAYIPPGVRCPMELSTYFRINAAKTGQFERTLLIADAGAYVSYLEGCTAPQRDENQLHAAVVELIAHEEAQIKYSTVQNWYPGDAEGRGGIYNFVTKRGACRGARSKISWTQVETGSAITWKYPSCVLEGDHSVGEFYSVAITNNRQQADTGNQDDPYRQGHALDDRLERHFGRPRTKYLSRSRSGATQGARRAQSHAMRLAADRRPLRRAYGALHRGAQPLGPGRARGNDVKDQRGPAILLPATGLERRGCGVADRQRLLQGSPERAADGICGRSAKVARRQPRGQRRLRQPDLLLIKQVKQVRPFARW